MNEKLQISLEDIAKQLKDTDSKYTTLQEVLDQLYGIGLNATHIVSLVTTGFTIPDLFKDFKPSNYLDSFMPKKYINVSKEESALARYEKLSVNHLLIILVSYNQSILENLPYIEKTIKQSMIEDRKDDVGVGINHMQTQLVLDKSKFEKLQCSLPNYNKNSLYEYIDELLTIQSEIFDVWLYEQDNNKLINTIRNETLKYYYINLLEISSEFPEVKLWVDLNFQKEIIASNENFNNTLNEIKEYQLKQFNNQFGLEEMNKLLSENTAAQLKKLELMIDSTTYDYITAHYKFIENNVNEELLEENDIKGLKLPTRQEIYIPQSYKYFYYNENSHKKNYLDSEAWSGIEHNEEEDIGKELFHALKNPHNVDQPIIILGHPGAGKSMFSSQFAYKLTNSCEYVPFLIKLRNIDSSNTDIDTHINEGIQNTIAGKPEVNWVEWVKKFPDRTPVFILDGFDELLRASQTQLNDYILKIKKVQKTAQNLGLNTRVILTSRLTIMQDVKIPDNSLVIKLNSFDQKRKDLWVGKWNEKQREHKHFNLPSREDIDELSKEPLLLFLLALYDFENNALNKIADEGLNKSSLYDRLFSEFTKRQLRKDPSYRSANSEGQSKMEQSFRLRIGFFALMLFLHDRVFHFEKDFDEELNKFNLSEEHNKAKNILDGFFFVHKDKSTDGHDVENLSFEFLHKTFGEFLAADFMIRLANYRAMDDEEISFLSNEKYFRQVFSFQWIYKQPKTLDFLIEHCRNIFVTTFSQQLIKIIKKELKSLVDENQTNVLPVALHQLTTFEKLKHTAIYSQNLVLLWASIEGNSFEFNLSKSINNLQSWQVFVDLWKNYGGYEFVTYLTKYFSINVINNTLMITKLPEDEEIMPSHQSNHIHYAHVINNSDEIILSYYESNFTLNELLNLQTITDEKVYKKLARLVVVRCDYIYYLSHEYFDDDKFHFLWDNISIIYRIKLFYFYAEKGIDFNYYRPAEELLSLIDHSAIRIEPSKVIMLIELYKEFKHERSHDLLGRFIENQMYGHNNSFSPSERLKLIEFYLESSEKASKDVIARMLRDLHYASKTIMTLSPKERLRLIELTLEVDGKNEFGFIDNELNSLQNELFDSGVFSISDKLCFLEFVLEVNGEKEFEFVEHELIKLYKSSHHRGRLSTNERFKIIEIYLEIKDDLESDILDVMMRQLHEVLLNRGDFRLKQLIDLEKIILVRRKN